MKASTSDAITNLRQGVVLPKSRRKVKRKDKKDEKEIERVPFKDAAALVTVKENAGKIKKFPQTV